MKQLVWIDPETQVVVPREPDSQWRRHRFGFFHHDTGAFEELIGPGWEERCSREFLNPRWVGGPSDMELLRAMLAAAPEVQGVELPERENEGIASGHYEAGWNDCLDAIIRSAKP